MKKYEKVFVSEWKELGRYTEGVRECVELLNSYGIERLNNKNEQK